MILFGQGIGLLIEAWKITKVVNVTIVPTAHGSLLPYRVAFEDKKELSASEKLTQEYDALAFRLVSYVMVPILVGYAVYSVLYQSHRSWYSYAVTTAAQVRCLPSVAASRPGLTHSRAPSLSQAVYMLGFASLIPGLVINVSPPACGVPTPGLLLRRAADHRPPCPLLQYKLKSVSRVSPRLDTSAPETDPCFPLRILQVAHLPFKTLIYKTLSTVVDDLCVDFSLP